MEPQGVTQITEDDIHFKNKCLFLKGRSYKVKYRDVSPWNAFLESQHGFPTVPWSTPLNSAYLVPSSCITNIWLSEGLCAGLLDARLTSRHSECWISSMIAIKSSSFTSFCPGIFYIDAGLPFAFSALSESGGVCLLAAHWMPVQSDTQMAHK